VEDIRTANTEHLAEAQTLTWRRVTKRHRWPLWQALDVARQLVDALTPSCDRIAIAGSVRRTIATVDDIELLAIPKYIDEPALIQTTLWPIVNNDKKWADAGRVNLLEETLDGLSDQGNLTMRPNKKGHYTNGPLNKLLIHTTTGIPIDLFTTSAENWGMALFVRTGPKDWNIKAMTRFNELGLAGHAYGGVTHPDGREEACPDEVTVFSLLEWPWREPNRRQ